MSYVVISLETMQKIFFKHNVLLESLLLSMTILFFQNSNLVPILVSYFVSYSKSYVTKTKTIEQGNHYGGTAASWTKA